MEFVNSMEKPLQNLKLNSIYNNKKPLIEAFYYSSENVCAFE